MSHRLNFFAASKRKPTQIMVFVTLVKIFAKNHERVYSDICSNRSNSKPETLLKRTECMFDLVSFLYHFLSRISKDFFQSPDKKATCFMQIQRKSLEISRNRELNWKYSSNFSKRNIFLHFKTTMIHFVCIL